MILSKTDKDKYRSIKHKSAIYKAIAIFVVLFVLFIGPWPVDNTHFQQTNYATQTIQNVNAITPDKLASQLTAGSASVEIKAPTNTPLAGYSARDPKENNGALEKIYAKAITIANNTKTVTLLTAEILLPLEELINAIVAKTGLARNDIYFTATHTHSGPGGYAHGIVEESSMGDFSHKQFTMLVDALSSAVLKSRTDMQPVTMKYSRLVLSDKYAAQLIYNQLADDVTTGSDSHNSIHVMELINNENVPGNKRIATLLTFSAHPTFLGRDNQKVSGDYPGALTKALEKKLGGNVMFSVGAVGGMLPAGNSKKTVKSIENQIKQLNNMGNDLSSTIADALLKTTDGSDLTGSGKIKKITRWQTDNSSIQSEIVSVLLPFPNYRLTDNLRLSPLLVNVIMHDNDTFMHAVKIGKLVFLSYPADYSGELAGSLEQWANDQDVYPWATSFNGEYLGYLMPSNRDAIKHYTTRDVNFYGKWTGDYFHEISKNIILNIK